MESRPNDLTPRQREVVRLFSLGCTREEAAAIMGVSPNTVDNHKFTAMGLLGISRQTLLVGVAIKNALTHVNDCLTAAEKRKSGRKNDGWN